jgi:hypothetical protein
MLFVSEGGLWGWSEVGGLGEATEMIRRGRRMAWMAGGVDAEVLNFARQIEDL